MSRGTNQKFKFTWSFWKVGWIFSFGKDVKVVGPSDVVEEMKAAAKEFIDNLQ